MLLFRSFMPLALVAAGLSHARADGAPSAPPASALPHEASEAGFVPLEADPVLVALLSAVEARPELARARAVVEAERQRAPQAGTLPDPTLALGIQNDGFDRIRIGEMETSFLSVSAAQSFPWLGKRALRAGVAALGAREAEADLARGRLDVEASVARAYIDLLEAREALGLLGRIEALWGQGEAAARARYEAGEGAQSELLRAQLERNRLRQRRFALEGTERQRLAVLNRLRGRREGDSLPTSRRLAELADPPLPALTAAIADAEARSPDLQRSAAQLERAHRQIALARKEALPDLTISAGIMPRGSLPPMWQAGVSMSVPLFSIGRQRHAVSEGEARAGVAAAGAEALRQLVRQRAAERHALLAALRESHRLYRRGLLVQSEATATSTLSQYRVGRVPFASVLEALVSHMNDISGFHASIAEAQRIALAMRAVSLDGLDGAVPPAGGGAMAGAGAPGAPEGGSAPVSAPGSAGNVGGASAGMGM